MGAARRQWGQLSTRPISIEDGYFNKLFLNVVLVKFIASWSCQPVATLYRVGGAYWLRPPTEPDVRVTYTAPHAKRTHLLILNQSTLFSSDRVLSPISVANHLLEYARSTARIWDITHRFLLLKLAADACLRGTPRFSNL